MEYLQEYFADLIAGREITAFWIVVGASAFCGCLFGAIGVLAAQEQIANRRRKGRV